MLLMKKFSNTNPSAIDGWTPLHAAASHGHLEVCEMILKNIQDIQGVMVECNGETPLALASDYRHLICMLLINSHIQSLILKDIQDNPYYRGIEVVPIISQWNSETPFTPERSRLDIQYY